MNIDQIEALVQIVSRSAVTEVTVRTEERRITVRRAHAQSAIQPSKDQSRDLGSNEMIVRSEQEALRIAAAESLVWVTAPLVGIFYHAEPPVSLGVEVKPGQVVGVIESMKLMNEVRSDHGGSVVESAIEAGMAVEYGQPLFAIRETVHDVEDSNGN